LIVTDAKNRPGHAWRPNPKCILCGPILTKLFVLISGVVDQRRPEKGVGSEMMLGSRERGPAAKQMWAPRGRTRPPVRTTGQRTMRCMETACISCWVRWMGWGGDAYLRR